MEWFRSTGSDVERIEYFEWIPSAVVMELIGYDSEEMSEHYTHVGQEAMRKAAEALRGKKF